MTTVWPSAPRRSSGANETSDVIVVVDDIIDDSISGSRSGARGKDDHAIDDDGGGTAIPVRRRSRRGRPRRFGVDGGGDDDGDGGEGDCDCCDGREDDEGDMAMRPTTLDDDGGARFTPPTAATIVVRPRSGPMLPLLLRFIFVLCDIRRAAEKRPAASCCSSNDSF